MRALLLSGLLLVASATVAAAEYSVIGGGTFLSVLPQGQGNSPVAVAPFELDRRPVTNAQFLDFVRAHPQWRRDRITALFADAQYLAHWRGVTDLGESIRPQQPVTRVSWFAAEAYCEASGARLPRWYEWEYAAAASESARSRPRRPRWSRTAGSTGRNSAVTFKPQLARFRPSARWRRDRPSA